MKLIFTLVLSLFINLIYSQEYKHFTEHKTLENQQFSSVFFIEKNERANAEIIKKTLEQIEGIDLVKIGINPKSIEVYILAKISVTPKEIKDILKSISCRINEESFVNKEIYLQYYPDNSKSEYSNIAPHYPKYINTGNPEKDAQEFDKLKIEWINNYPHEYDLMMKSSQN